MEVEFGQIWWSPATGRTGSGASMSESEEAADASTGVVPSVDETPAADSEGGAPKEAEEVS